MTYLGHTILQLPNEDMLPSQQEILQLLHGLFGDEDGSLKGFKGWDHEALHCPRKPDGVYTCSEPAGCVARGAFCFVYMTKEVWVNARLPTVQDKSILGKIKTLRENFYKQCKKKFSEAYVAELGKTFSLAPRDYRAIVMGGAEEEPEKLRKLRILDDYVGPAASRYVQLKGTNI